MTSQLDMDRPFLWSGLWIDLYKIINMKMNKLVERNNGPLQICQITTPHLQPRICLEV